MSDRSSVQPGKCSRVLTQKGFHNELVNKTKAFNKETKKLQSAIDKLYETFNNAENVGITEALKSVMLSKDVFENVVLSLRELSALDRWGESTEVKDTVNSTAAKFLQATDEAIHEAKRRLHLADEIIHAAGCKTTTSSVETSIRSGLHSSLKSEHRKALADAVAAKEQAEYKMIIARKINERKQLEAKEEHRRLTEKAQYEHVAILEAKKTEAIAKAKLDAIEQSITDDEI
ncbi:Hypothetical predicted protein, partial [Paramuricea clavata]